MSSTDEFGFPIAGGFPAIDAPGMVQVDLLMVQSYGITLPQMMENAGRALAIVARRRYLPGDLAGRHVVVLAGSGGNGGGAMVAARRLLGWGARVSLILSAGADTLHGVPADQFAILKAMGLIPVEVPTAPVDLIVDGLIGYSLRGAPKGRAAKVIGWANRQSAPILALDVPSGFDAISGATHEPFIRADATLTLGLPKCGLQADGMAETVGALYLADISVPPALFQRLSRPLDVPPFAGGDILRVAPAQSTRIAKRFWRKHKIHRVLGASVYTLSAGAALVGISNAVIIETTGPWSFSSTILCGIGTRSGTSCAQPALAWGIMGAALLGMAFSSLQRGSFRLRLPRPGAALRHGAGGALMGIGTVMVPGGNDGMILFAIPSLSPHALPAYAGDFGGILATLAIMRTFGRRIPPVLCTGDICRVL